MAGGIVAPLAADYPGVQEIRDSRPTATATETGTEQGCIVVGNVVWNVVYTNAAITLDTDYYPSIVLGNTAYAVNSATNVIMADMVLTNVTIPSGSFNNFIWNRRAADPPAPPPPPDGATPEQLFVWECHRAAHEAVLAERRRLEATERQLREEWAREEGIRHAEKTRIREAAERKAEELLRRHLDPAQLDQLQKTKSFDIVLKARFGLGSKRYRIRHGWAGNVYRLDDQGREIERFCIHHTEPVPIPDLMLAQKLMLECEEERFLKVANRTRLAVP